jgi:hypothetical protein
MFSTTADMKTSPTTAKSTTKSSTTKSSTTERSTTSSNSACSQAPGAVAHGLRGRSDECSTPNDYCPIFDLPSYLNILDDDEGTDDGSLLPGLNNPNNPSLAAQKRSSSLAGRINLGVVDENGIHKSGSWHDQRRTANWSDLVVRQAGRPKGWLGPTQCPLGKSVFGPSYPKASELPKFAPQAKFWYVTSVAGSRCQAWTIAQSPGTGISNNGPGLTDARSNPYQFGPVNENSRLPDTSYLSTDHVCKLFDATVL